MNRYIFCLIFYFYEHIFKEDQVFAYLKMLYEVYIFYSMHLFLIWLIVNNDKSVAVLSEYECIFTIILNVAFMHDEDPYIRYLQLVNFSANIFISYCFKVQ